ncbi:hypothetical protein [Actinomadura sp. 9N215]|uniref:AMIN-like domain-containing (lipo)protein n=1 Tax=Actinomadura sp. 9N215 TaxID=3375150 RepID=UPI0037AFF084
MLTLVLSAVLVGVLGTSASAACDTAWGTHVVARVGSSNGQVERLHTERQTCYDELVIEVDGSGFSYLVGYVDEVEQVASGKPISLRGGAKLQIDVRADAAPGFPSGSSELADVGGYTAFRQVAGAGSFEAHTRIGLGVREVLPFRVRTFPRDGGGELLVVDVAHTG